MTQPNYSARLVDILNRELTKLGKPHRVTSAEEVHRMNASASQRNAGAAVWFADAEHNGHKIAINGWGTMRECASRGVILTYNRNTSAWDADPLETT